MARSDTTPGINAPRLNVKLALFALSGNQCAFPDCDEAVFQDDSIVSQISHIHARNPGGPRFNSEMTDDEVHSLDNLLLLCSKHHKIVDDHPDTYPAEALSVMKRMHEASAKPTAPAALHRLIEALSPAALPNNWWQRPGLPKFWIHPAVTRRDGACTFHLELEQQAGEEVGDLLYAYILDDKEAEYREPRLLRDRKWRLQTLEFESRGQPFELRLRFWWTGDWRVIKFRWEHEDDFQRVEQLPTYA